MATTSFCKRWSTVRRLSLAGVLLAACAPGFGASSLRIQCDQEASLPAHALVCEYSLLKSANDRLADLVEDLIAAGRARGLQPEKWMQSRDGCSDVDCIDRALESALAEAEKRGPVPVRVVDMSPVVRNAQAKVAEPRRGLVKVAAQQDTSSVATGSVQRSMPVYAAVILVFGVALILGALLVCSRGRDAACAKCGKWFARRETRSVNSADQVYADEHFMRLDQVDYRCKYCGSQMIDESEDPAVFIESSPA